MGAVAKNERLSYSIKGACHALGDMSKSTFYRRAREGHFHIYFDGGKALVSADEVEAYNDRLKVQALAKPKGILGR